MALSAILLDVALDNPARVVAGVVRDDDQRAANIGMELLEKVHKTDAVHFACEAAELHVSTRADGADEPDAEAVAAVLDRRRLPDLTPGRSSMCVGPHRRLIDKVDRGPYSTRFGPQAGKRLIEVVLHLLWIALVAPVNRSLRTQPQMLEQAAHSTLAHFHAMLLLQQSPHDRQRPQAIRQLILPRVAQRNRVVKPLQHFRLGLSWPPALVRACQAISPPCLDRAL